MQHDIFFIKYQLGYMFQPREVIIKLALEYSNRNTQTALLETEFYFFTVQGC
jgi:hypothetical protein